MVFPLAFTCTPRPGREWILKLEDNVVLVLNRNAIRVIPESLDVGGLLDYLHLAQRGKCEKTWRYWKKCAGGWILSILMKARDPRN